MKNRNIILSAVFSLISCGVYSFYWMFQLVKSVPTLTRTTPLIENPIIEALLCCTPYSWFWAYKTGENFDNAGINGISAGSNKIIFLILAVVGLNIVNYCVIQNEINKVTPQVQ